MPFMYNLGRLRQTIEEACGLDITHSHEDLVFVEHSAFMVRFDHKDETAFQVFFNPECPDREQVDILASLQARAIANGLQARLGGSFTLEALPDKEEFQIHFQPLSP